MEAKSRTNIFVAGGTAKIGKEVIKYIEKHNNLSIAGTQNRSEISEALDSYKMYAKFPIDNLHAVDIVSDCSSTECTQKNLKSIGNKKSMISSRKRPLLYFTITPDVSIGALHAKTSNIIKQFSRSNYSKIFIKIEDNISGIRAWFTEAIKSIEELLKNEDKIERIELHDRHRGDKGVGTQDILNVIEERSFIKPVKKMVISEKIKKIKGISNPKAQIAGNVMRYTCQKRKDDNLSLTLCSNRKYSTDELKEKGKSDVTCSVGSYTPQDDRVYISRLGFFCTESKDKKVIDKFAMNTEQNAKNFVDMAIECYHEIIETQRKEKGWQRSRV